ncbi:hypothetical protein ZHAS_00013123 [Anopheles sinensis]|uniref:Uncharacterized protein n=1 Tax=Anopheles sinensis TaxID=74873 RepID=A0A084W4M1_ANOSI|nr:hypothetical protein ZHAS_00013123 [Anopheles sinensis]
MQCYRLHRPQRLLSLDHDDQGRVHLSEAHDRAALTSSALTGGSRRRRRRSAISDQRRYARARLKTGPVRRPRRDDAMCARFRAKQEEDEQQQSKMLRQARRHRTVEQWAVGGPGPLRRAVVSGCLRRRRRRPKSEQNEPNRSPNRAGSGGELCALYASEPDEVSESEAFATPRLVSRGTGEGRRRSDTDSSVIEDPLTGSLTSQHGFPFPSSYDRPLMLSLSAVTLTFNFISSRTVPHRLC